MARFRLLLVGLTIWLIIIFNLARPELLLGEKDLSFNLSPLVYLMASLTAIVILLLPDLGRANIYLILIPVLGIYLVSRFMLDTPDPATPKHTFYFIVTEIVVLFLTVVVVRAVSLAVTNFEMAVENVVLRPANSRILSMADGEDKINSELLRARRFDRPVGFIVVRITLLEAMRPSPAPKLTLESAFQRHYLQTRIGQEIEASLHQSDIFAWYNDDLIVCLPEMDYGKVLEPAKEIDTLLHVRLGIHVPMGLSAFPESGLIYKDLIEAALRNPYHFELEDTQNPPNDDGDSQANTNAAREGLLTRQPSLPDASSRVNLSSLLATFRNLPNLLPVTIPGTRKRTDTAGAKDPDFWVNRLPYQSASSRGFYRIIKRAIDLGVVTLSAPIVIPLVGLISLLILIDSGRPIFFVQERTGLGGRRFKMHKFRTMIPNAEALLHDLARRGLAKLDAQGKLAEPLKLQPDPRVTRIGRFLRKTSLDELPQLIDVAQGNMSLVGPRPTSWDVSSYSLLQTERLSVRPGITGLWQIYSRGTTDFNTWVQWDVLYMDKMSLSLDLQILWQTVGQVFSHRGAH